MEMHFHQARHSTQNNPSPHQAQSTTCCECTVNQAPPHARGDPHDMISACLPKCRLQKLNPWRQGNAPVYDAANGRPELNVAIWTRCESGQNCGGRPYTLPHAVSALIMVQADKDFPQSALAGLKTHKKPRKNPGLLPVPYHQINIYPKH